MNVLFVTSGNNRMYEKTGHTLINTISKKYPILLCTEGYSVTESNKNIFLYDLKHDEWLQTWLRTYAHIIPVEFGGSCVDNLPYFKKHAAKWMCKVAALRHARFNYEFDVLIWIDIDTEMRNVELDNLIHNSIHGVSCFYIDGYMRRFVDMGIETGIIGFDNKYGLNILDDWFAAYETGDFIRMKRWDDGYVFRDIVQNRGYKTRDLVHKNLFTHMNILLLFILIILMIQFKMFIFVLIVLFCVFHFVAYTSPLTMSTWNPYVTHLKGTQKHIR